MVTQSKSSSSSIMKKKIEVILLVSGYGETIQQRTNQNRARTILNGAINASLSSSSSQEEIAIKEIDATDPSNKELRTELFQVSGIRGDYPQIFIRHDEEQAEKGSVSATNTSMIGYKFVGGFAELEAYNDYGSLLKTILLQEDGDYEGVENDANEISGTGAIHHGGDCDDGNRGGPPDDANKIAAVGMTNEQQGEEKIASLDKKKDKDDIDTIPESKSLAQEVSQ